MVSLRLGLLCFRRLRRVAERTPLLHHRLELRGTCSRLSLVGDADAFHSAPFEVWVASLKSAAAHELQVHSWLAVADKRGKVATLARRECDAVLDPLAHARIRAEDRVTHAPHRAL